MDVTIYAKPGYDALQMKEIRLGLEDGIDVSYYTNPVLFCKEMEQIRKELLNRKQNNKSNDDFDVEPKYYYSQLKEIFAGLDNNINVSIYADPKFTSDQMREIRLGLENGV